MLIQVLTDDPKAIIKLLESGNLNQSCAVLLMQDGVYCANELAKHDELRGCLYVLEADCAASGIKVNDTVQTIDYQQWVSLTCSHTPILTFQ